MRRVVWLLGLCALASCKDEVPKPIEIPSEVHGLFGRNSDDLYHGTRGLEIDGTSLRFSEMTLVVTDGKMIGDTFQIGRAEVRWAKDDPEKLPKECKGTLARQGDRLLLTLFKKDSDEACESILKGEWTEWKEITTLPEALHGRYGASDAYAGRLEVTVGPDGLKLPGDGDALKVATAYRFVRRDDELFVTEATYGETKCHGTITLSDEQLSVATTTEADDAFCPVLQETRWKVDATKIPKGALTNGKVTATFDGESVTLANTDTPALTCKQTIVRTSPRATTDKAMDDLPVLAGQVLTLAPADPSGKESCVARLGNVMQHRCQERLGAPCPDDVVVDTVGDTDVACPSHIVVGDPTGPGRKVALLPDDLITVACFDVTGDFKGS